MRLRSSESQFSYEMCQTHIYKETKKHPHAHVKPQKCVSTAVRG